MFAAVGHLRRIAPLAELRVGLGLVNQSVVLVFGRMLVGERYQIAGAQHAGAADYLGHPRKPADAVVDHGLALVRQPFRRADAGVDRAAHQRVAALRQHQPSRSLVLAADPGQPHQRLEAGVRERRVVDDDVTVLAGFELLLGLWIDHARRGGRPRQDSDLRKRRIKLAQDFGQSFDVVAVEQQQAETGPAEIIE